MYGEWMGELKVKIKDIATGKISILRTLKGNKGNIWNKEEVLFVVNGDFKVSQKGWCWVNRKSYIVR